MKTLKLKAIALLFMLAIGMNAMAAGTVVRQPSFPPQSLGCARLHDQHHDQCRWRSFGF